MKHFILIFILATPYLLNSQTVIDTIKQNHLIDEIVVSVNKIEESKRYVSHQVKLIDNQSIAKLRGQTIADILNNSGAVTMQKSQQGGGSPVIRGFEASRVLVVVDGVRMNNLIYRAGHLQNLITVDENTIDRAEVLYGPASTMYGSDALGGSVHLYTIIPKLKTETGKVFTGNAFTKYNSVNTGFKNHACFNLSTANCASLTSLTYSKFGDLRMGTKPFGNNQEFGKRPYFVKTINGSDSLCKNPAPLVQKFSGYNQFDFMQKFLFKQNNKFNHLLNFQYSASSNIPRYDRLTDKQGDNGLKYAEWYYGPQKRFLASYNLNAKQLFQETDFLLNLNYQDITESRHQRKFQNNWLQNRSEHVNVFGLNAGFSSKLNSVRLSYGIEAVYDKVKSVASNLNIIDGSTKNLDTRYPDGKNTMFQSGIYASLLKYLSEKTAINGGARIGYSVLNSNQIDTSFFRLPLTKVKQANLAYSFYTGLVINPLQWLKLNLNIASGYRVPNIDDLSKVFDTATGTLIVPNENLQPEKTITPDFGVTIMAGNWLKMENTVFYTRLFDAIVAAGFELNGKDSVLYDGQMSKVIANQNLRKAAIYGYSGSFDAKVNSYFSVFGSVNITRGKIINKPEKQPLDHIAPLYGRFGVTCTPKRFQVEFYILFNGKKDISDYYLNGEDNEQYAPKNGTPAWCTLNLNTSFKVSDNLLIMAGIDNITDVQYRTFASGINSGGRNFNFMLKLKI